ncbi:MAG: vWA domain-containing protein [Bacillota bacterium]
MVRLLGGRAQLHSIKRGCYLLALALFLAGALKPVLYRNARAIDYLVVFDVSLSMTTEDYVAGGAPKSRLEMAKEQFRRILPRLPPESRITLAGFVGARVQVFLWSRPVQDVHAIYTALNVIRWDNVWDAGSRVDLGVEDIARRAFGSSPPRPNLPAPLNVFFFTDGGSDSIGQRLALPGGDWLRENLRVTFVGVGRPRESPVPALTPGRARDCLRKATGECFTSSLNEETLRALAAMVGGRYEPLRDEDGGRLRRLFLENPLKGAEVRVPQDVGWLFGLASLAVFLLWIVL